MGLYQSSARKGPFLGGLQMHREANINQPTPDVIAANPGVNIDALRPCKGYNSVGETDNVASSIYNSLQVSWNRRFSKGIGFGPAYTLSKSLDDGSAQRDIIPDTYYAHNLWGQSDFDVRHIFVATYIYGLPFFHNQRLSGRLLGGWQFSGIVQFQTGTPSSVAVGTDYVGVGQDGSMSGGGQFWSHTALPSVTGQAALNGSGDPFFWFSTCSVQTTSFSACPAANQLFQQPAKGTFVQQDDVRNIVHNPGLEDWNL